MEVSIRYRGLMITSEDLDSIRSFIADRPHLSRRALSVELCRTRGWVQANGSLRDMVTRGLLLHLHREGHIVLPEKRRSPPNNVARHKRPVPVPLLQWTPLEGPLTRLLPLSVRQVRRTPDEALFDSLLETHHYLGYTRPVGEHLKYLVFAQGVPISCLSWSSAPRHIGVRDRFIGWCPDVRRRHVHLLAYNSRFLILPWGRIPHLASHILGAVCRRISADWEQLYDHPLWFLETFVDPERFRGTCYRAANWVNLGLTTGRGKDDLTHTANRSLKEVLGYPLSRDFRKQLGVS